MLRIVYYSRIGNFSLKYVREILIWLTGEQLYGESHYLVLPGSI